MGSPVFHYLVGKGLSENYLKYGCGSSHEGRDLISQNLEKLSKCIICNKFYLDLNRIGLRHLSGRADLAAFYENICCGRCFRVLEDRRKATFGRRRDFFETKQWEKIRYDVLRIRGAMCACCGRDQNTGAILQVDHIKPRSKYPELSLDFSNLQVLCKECNFGKSNTDETDWRF